MDQPAQTNTFFSKVSKYLLFALPTISLLVAFTILSAWVFNLEVPKRILPNLSAMNPITAFLFLLTSASFLLSQLSFNLKFKKIIILTFLSLVFIVASVRLFEIISSLGWGIDLLLFKDQILQPGSPARMSQATALSFIGISSGFFVITLFKHQVSIITGQLLTLITLIISSSAAIFFTFGISIFLQTQLFFSMALHTTLLFLLLSLWWFLYVYAYHQTDNILTNLKLLASLFFLMTGLWWYTINPQTTRIANDFSYSADIYSIDNLYDTDIQEFSGEILSNTTFSYEVVSSNQEVLEVKNVFDVKKPTGEPIFSVERLYGIDAISTRHLPEYGDKSREGYLFSPPNQNQEEFTYWHINYDQPLTMKLVEKEEVKGLEVNKYHTEFTADQTKELDNLPEVGETRGINLDVELTLWVEPTTGRMIKYEDEAIAYYYDLATNKKIEPWNKFRNNFTEASIEEQVRITQELIQTIFFTKYVIPFVLASIGLSLLVVIVIQTFTKIQLAIYLPAIIFTLGILTTILAWRVTLETIDYQTRIQFEHETSLIEDDILDNLAIYAQALQGGEGLFQASEEVNRDEFKKYVETLNLQKNYPGIQGIGYSIFVQPEDLEGHIAEIRAEGFPDFTVRPEGERDIYSSIVFLEPFDFRNRRAFGFDMFQEPNRRKAMENARDTNTPTISGKITLVQETETDIQFGFLMYVPLFQKNTVINTVDQRREAIIGYVYAPFRIGDLINNTLRNSRYKIDLTVFDTDIPSDDTKMYQLNLDGNSGETHSDFTPLYTKDAIIHLYDHQWTLRFRAFPDYGLNVFQESAPSIAIIAGTTLSLVMTLATYALASARGRALTMANQMTQDLQEKSKQLNDINKNLMTEVETRKKTERNLKQQTTQLEKMNKLMINRELKMIELKKKLKK